MAHALVRAASPLMGTQELYDPDSETALPNRLISEKSPYLQQHAHNPVDWHPWGEEAFAQARQENKPIFLSIGYSTCHWCHVMEHESFENEEIAALLNRFFVSIKVDREERPDVDRIYMTYVQAATGSGGWPMSVFLTPDLKPFFGGTYFPPDNRYGRPGFATLLERVAEAWKNEHDRIVESSAEAISQLARYTEGVPGTTVVLDATVFDSTFQYFRRTFDSEHGGFGEAPKFPRPVVFNFLLRYYVRTNRKEALDMTLDTLRAMANGGMHDQLGGGFHRYSVDERWFVPHFEKMLYDQAQLAVSYLEAFQITHDDFYAGIARSTLDYVLRDMTNPEGGFYSAEDADNVIDPAQPEIKGEGAFYVWTAEELQDALGPVLYAPFAKHYGVEDNGNVYHDPHGEFTGKNILYLREPPDPYVAAQLAEARQKLLDLRSRRIRPHLDDKILTSWNGLMVSAFAKAAQILDEPRYLAAAQRATEFILSKMHDRGTGTLLRRYREGEAAIQGFLDDYAFFIAALVDLYEADFDPGRIELAMTLTSTMRNLFEDADRGAFFSTAAGDSSLILRLKEDYDGAEPSGNSLALLDLLRLAHITDQASLRESAERTLQALGSKVSAQPVASPQILVAVDYYDSPRREVVLAGPRDAQHTGALLRSLHAHFLPRTVSFLIDSDQTRRRLAVFFPAVAKMREVNGQPTAYVCQNYACQLPTNELSKFDELLQ